MGSGATRGYVCTNEPVVWKMAPIRVEMEAWELIEEKGSEVCNEINNLERVCDMKHLLVMNNCYKPRRDYERC